MSNIFLSKMTLRDFRAYKTATEISFPAQPSLTVIVGQNGLGKSTIFDALEWGLTGHLKRINDIDAKDSEKTNAIGENAEVCLNFGEDLRIQATKSGINAFLRSRPITINEALIRPRWKSMENLADSLQLTHFLGQSTKQLFIHQNNKNRWSRIEGPAGMARLSAIQTALGRNQTTLAMTRLATQYQQEQIALEETLQYMGKLIADIHSSESTFQANAILTTDDILQQVNEALQVLGYKTCTEDIPTLLETLKEYLNKQKADLAADSGHLAEWSKIAYEYMAKAEQLLLLERQQAALEKKLESALHERETAESLMKAAQDQQVSTEKALTESRRQLTLVERSAAQTVAASKLNDLLAMEHARAREIEGSINVAEKTLQVAEGVRQSQARLRQEHDSIDVYKRHLDQLLDLCSKHHTVGARLSLAEQSSRMAAARIATLLTTQEHIQLRIRNAETNIGHYTEQLTKARNNSDALNAAVSEIASRLTALDCECPVCKSTFTQPGDLQKLATKTAKTLDSHILELESYLRDSEYEAENLSSQLTSNVAEIIETERAQEQAHTTQAEYQWLETTLRSDPLLANIPLSDFLMTITREQDIASIRIISVRQSLAELDHSIEEKVRLEQQHLQISQDRDTLLRTHEQIALMEQQLASMRDRYNSVETAQGELEKARAAMLHAEQTHAYCIDLMQTQTTQFRHANTELSDCLTEKSRRVYESEGLIQGRAEMLRAWQELGYSGEPLPVEVTALQTQLPERQKQLETLNNQHQWLLLSWIEKLSNEKVQNSRQELNNLLARHDEARPDALNARLIAERQTLITKLEALNNLRKRQQSIIRHIRERSARIREQVSQPLNDSIARFCAALLTDKNYQLKLDTIASAASSQALLSMRFDDMDDKDSINPLLYLSEGQLAAVNLCVLMASSVTYPWSNWRALLLDDPLHHNDSIHTAAFIDVIRNLILHQGYQVIISTHDMDQAGYFLRKCTNAGIPTRYWHLYGKSSEGVMLERGPS